MHTGFWWENLKERDHLEDPGIVGRIMLNGSSGSRWGVMDWIHLAQDRDSNEPSSSIKCREFLD